MAVYAKKRKPFIFKFFVTILLIVLIFAVVLGALWCYLNFAKKVNYVSAISQISALNVGVDESKLTANAPTESDLVSVKNKLQAQTLSIGSVEISDKEFCAYFNEKIENRQITLKFAGSDYNAKDVDMQVLQIVFNAPTQVNDALGNINIAFKFATKSFEQNSVKFPLSIFGKIPDIMYVEASGLVLASDNSYVVTPLEMKLNTLNVGDSQNVINFFDLFIHCGDAQTLNTQILQHFCDELIGKSQGVGIFNLMSGKVDVGYETNYSFLRNGKFNINVDVAKYGVKVVQMLGTTQTNLAGIISGVGDEFLYGESTTLFVTENNGYKFLGWYDKENAFLGNEKSLIVEDIKADKLFYARFEYITKTITYTNTKDADNSANPTQYNISYGIIKLNNLTNVNGYEFVGWFDGNNKVVQINSALMQDYLLEAHWDLIVYTITCIVNGTDETYTKKYTIESEAFTLYEPTKDGTNFTGWTGGNLDKLTKTVTIPKGSYGDLQFFAHFEDENEATNIVKLVVDGKDLTSFEIGETKILNKDTINSFANGRDFGMAGYSVNNWYTDSTQKTLFTPKTINSQLTLYGSWTYFMDNMLFMPYLDEFNKANTQNSNMTFDSRDKLVAWIDYVIFYNVSRPQYSKLYPTFDLTYITDNKMGEVDNAYKNIWCNQIHYQTVAYVFLRSDNCFFIKGEMEDPYNIDNMATRPTEGTTLLKPQVDNLLTIENTTQRTSSNLPIDNVPKIIANISNTEQLVRVLEQGYKPICVQNSSAEKIYNKARGILKDICNDEMTDVEKLRAIYEWLILNVKYDYNIVNRDIENNYTRLYASWFAEGVFNNGVAVCEGYAKSALIMARMEGIPAVYVTGGAMGKNHAWNKVQIDGVWYEFDATHGDAVMNGSEVTTYTKFLFPSIYRAFDYPATIYQNISCVTNYNFYENAKYKYNNEEFDLFINSESELGLLVSYIKSKLPLTTKSSVEIASNLSNISTAFNRLKGGSNLSLYSQQQADSAGRNIYIIIIN